MERNLNVVVVVLVLVLPLSVWLLLPLEPIEDGNTVVATVDRHFQAKGNKASPKPYYLVTLENGQYVEVQDYGQLRAQKGEKVLLLEQFGKFTNRRTFKFLGEAKMPNKSLKNGTREELRAP